MAVAEAKKSQSKGNTALLVWAPLLQYAREIDAELTTLRADVARLAEALRRLVPEPVDEEQPGWIAYVGDDAASCTYCGRTSGNPYEVDEVRAWKHEADCPILQAHTVLEGASKT